MDEGDRRLLALENAATALSKVRDLSSPQIIGAHIAILEAYSFDHNHDCLWEAVRNEFNERPQIKIAHVNVLWYHGALRDALCRENSAGILEILNLFLDQTPTSPEFPPLATEVTYQEIKDAILKLNISNQIEAPLWLREILKYFVSIIIAPARDVGAEEELNHDESQPMSLGMETNMSSQIEQNEGVRSTVCRLVCLFITRAIAQPTGPIAQTFLSKATSTPIIGNRPSSYNDVDDSSFMYAFSSELSQGHDDNRPLFQCLDECLLGALQVQDQKAWCPGEEARRYTLLNQLFPALYSPLGLPAIWGNLDDRMARVWAALRLNVGSCAELCQESIRDLSVQRLRLVLGAACLLVDGAELAQQSDMRGRRYCVPHRTLWDLIFLGLSSSNALDRRRGLHLLRTVVLLTTEHSKSLDSNASKKAPQLESAQSKKKNVSKTRVRHGTEWLSFLKAFEIYDNEFQLHLVEQVWPLLKRLCTGSLVAHHLSREEEDHLSMQPFWALSLPPLSYAMVRLLISRSLCNDNPGVVKFGLEKLFKGETCAMPANPALLFPPSWVCTMLIQVLDDAKLYRDHAPTDAMGRLVSTFLRTYLTSRNLPPQLRKEFVVRLADVVSRNPSSLLSDNSQCLKCHVTMFHLLSVFGTAAEEETLKLNQQGAKQVEENSSFYGTIAEALSHGASSALDCSLLNAITDRLLGAERFSNLNSYMQAAVLRGVVPLVTYCCHADYRSVEDGILSTVSKFLSKLPEEAFREEFCVTHNATSSFELPLQSHVRVLGEWCASLTSNELIHFEDLLRECIVGDNSMSQEVCLKGLARMVILNHFHQTSLEPNTKDIDVFPFPELNPVFEVLDKASTSHLSPQRTRRALQLLHLINLNAFLCGGQVLNDYRNTLTSTVASSGATLGLSLLYLTSGLIHAAMSELALGLDLDSQEILFDSLNALTSTLRVEYGDQQRTANPLTPPSLITTKSAATKVAMELIHRSCQLIGQAGKEESNETGSMLVGVHVIHMVMQTAYGLVFTPNVSDKEEERESCLFLETPTSTPSYSAPFFAQKIIRTLIESKIPNQGCGANKATSKQLRCFLEHKWAAVVLLASAHPNVASELMVPGLFEACFSAACTASMGFSRVEEVPLAIAFHATAPLLNALLNPSPISPDEASHQKSRRDTYLTVSEVAWSVFEESGNYRPSIAEALAKLLLQPSFFDDKELVKQPEDDATNLLSDVIKKFIRLAQSGRPHVLRAATARFVVGLSEHPESAHFFVPDLVTLLLYREDRMKLYALPSEGGKWSQGLEAKPITNPIDNVKEHDDDAPPENKLTDSFVRVMVLQFIEGVADGSSSFGWCGQLALALLGVHLDLTSNPLNPILNTPSYGRRLRSIQALCVLAPLIPPQVLELVHEKLWAIIQQPVTHMIRFYLDMFSARLAMSHPIVIEQLLTQLQNQNQTAQTLSSLTTIAAYLVFGHQPNGCPTEVKIWFPDLLQAVLPYCLYPSSFVRTVAQIVCFELLPDFIQPSPEQTRNDHNTPLEHIYSFLKSNVDAVKLRKKQNQFVRRLQPLVYCRLGEMLSHSDEFQEISQVSLSELVLTNLRELYLEGTQIEGSASSSHSTFFHDWSVRGSSIPTKALTVQEEEEGEDEEEVGEIQRKIRVWWEGLELTSALTIKRETTATGRPNQSGLVVCASLVDKTPNLAGLTRTCEIFGAASLVLPNLQVVKSDEFKSISVTSEGWVPLEEVKEDNLLLWLQQKRREGFKIVGLEQTSKSYPIVGENSQPFPDRTVLLLGKEREGIPVHFLREVDMCFEIPQLGVVRSLNVHVSGAVAIWEYTRQKYLN